LSGCVTVTGPPASICALNFGTTDPLEASTLPNRTEISRMCGLPFDCVIRSWSSAWQYISAKRLVSPSIETGSIALSVEIITIAVAPAAIAASATLTDPKMLVLTPSLQSRSRIGTCFRAAAWKTISGLNSRIRFMIRSRSRISAIRPSITALAPRGAEGRDAVADLRTNRAAAAGDDHRLAFHQRFEPRVVDLLARPQQQVFDGDIGQPRHIAAFERRQAADEQAEPPGAHQDRLGMRLGFERRRGHHDSRDRFSPSSIVADHILDIVEAAEHRHVADRLAAVRGRRRQHADRPKLLDRAALDCAQQHLGVGGAADQQRRRRPFGPGMAANARVTEIAIAETERAQREHLEEPEEHDGDAAEQHRRLAARCPENEGVVQHDERHRQNAGHAQDVQRIWERNKTPFRRRQVEDVADHDAENDEEGQNTQQQRQAGIEGLASLEA